MGPTKKIQLKIGGFRIPALATRPCLKGLDESLDEIS